jgi:uncharacterized membrane protein SpoIIM required for sporulation
VRRSGRREGILRDAAPFICVVIVVYYILGLASFAFYLLAISPENFFERSDVKEFENTTRRIGELDEAGRTLTYLSNNLGAGVRTMVPVLGFVNVVYNGWFGGMVCAYVYRKAGTEVLLLYIAGIYVHGILELTGFFILGGLSLYLLRGGWRRLLSRYLKLAVLGLSLIAIAAPVEAYLTPAVIDILAKSGWMLAAIIPLVAFFYIYVFFIRLGGLNQIVNHLHKR